MTHKSSRHQLTAPFTRPLNRRPLAMAISTLLLGGVLAGTVQAQTFPAVVKLADLDESSGFRLDGVSELDNSGRSVSAAGDINGDGIDDLIIGAPRASPDGNFDAGSTYVVFGRDVSTLGDFPVPMNLSSLNGTTGFRLDGVATGDSSGFSVSAAGDINGDGIDDLIIGAPHADPDDNDLAGSSYVVFGRDVSAVGDFPASVNLFTLNGSTGFRIDGVPPDKRSGISVSAAGDINGDGIDDLIIGADFSSPNVNFYAGSSYVVFGRDVSDVGDFPVILPLSSLDGGNGFGIDGESPSDYSGLSVSAAGDINGDDIDDLIIGADSADPNGNDEAGSSYVVFGRNVSSVGDFPATLALSSLDGSSGFRLDGIASGDHSGFSVSAAGDINGDGIDDLIIGADRAGSTEAGSSYVVFGRNGGFPATLNLSSLNGSTGFRLDGSSSGDRSGISVSGAGDINGDGIDDLIIGADRAAPDGMAAAGSSYVVFGRNVSAVGSFPATLDLSSLDGSNGFRLDGAGALYYSGSSVSSAGDINGDGVDDLIIGSYRADPDGNGNAGSSYVVYGRGPDLFADRFETE
jgi:hypothetical protein